MTTHPKVSVLMLAYNQEQYIDEAIRGVVLQQASFPYVLVIGDDASTDGTTDRCRQWQQRYPDKVRLLERPRNMGMQRNFLETYAACEGDYVAICEGDDYWCDSAKLQRQVDFMEAHPDYAICFHRVVNYYQEQGVKSLSNGGQQEDAMLLDLARGNFISNVSVLFRRQEEALPDWFAEVETYDYALHMLHAQHGKIHYLESPMAVYRKHDASIWSKAGAARQYLIAMDVRQRLMSYFADRNPEVYDALHRCYLQNAAMLCLVYRQEGDGEAADRVQADALRQASPALWTQLLDERQSLLRQKHYVRRVLKGLRAQISKCMPLPRIREPKNS